MTQAFPLERRSRRGACAAALVAALFTTAPLDAWAQSCSVQPLRFLCDGCTVPRRVTVQKDNGCVFINDTETVILGITVKLRPRNGSFGRSSETLQAYVPKRGFVGQDYFEYVLTHEIAGKRANTVIQNHITVTP